MQVSGPKLHVYVPTTGHCFRRGLKNVLFFGRDLPKTDTLENSLLLQEQLANVQASGWSISVLLVQVVAATGSRARMFSTRPVAEAILDEGSIKELYLSELCS